MYSVFRQVRKSSSLCYLGEKYEMVGFWYGNKIVEYYVSGYIHQYLNISATW